MVFYKEIWFWLLILGILFIFIGMIFQFAGHHTGWFLLFLFLGLLFIFIAIIAAAVSGGTKFAAHQTEQATQLLQDPGVQQMLPYLLL